MKAYHGNSLIKQEILAQLKAHYEADEIVKGIYWQNGKGCAVGCTIHSNDHKEYETRFGIPRIIARLEDVIFENLPNDKAKEWPLTFMKAIQVGADLTDVWRKFAIIILSDPDKGVLRLTKPESKQHIAIQNVISLYEKNTASAAAYASAADAADAAYAAYAYAYAAAAASAADAAADAAAYAAAYAAADTRKIHFEWMADVLLGLLHNAPVE